MELSRLAWIVFQTELEQMQLNLDSCSVELDAVCLHDLRVAERRTRAALSEFKELFPDPIVRQFQSQFRWLHQATNSLRDLDVGIAHFPRYRRKIPPFQRKHLEPALAVLLAKRQEARRQLVEILAAGRPAAILGDWSAALERGFSPTGMADLVPAAEYGRRRICNRYRSLTENALELSPYAPSSDFHALRIKAKKLRYQIEFYSPVLERKRVHRVLKRLKRFQDILGDFQDAVVQVEHIQTLAEELAGGELREDTQLTLERLIASYSDQVSALKKRSYTQVSWLVSSGAARTFQACFSCPEVDMILKNG